VRLINVIYHVEINDGSVAKLIAQSAAKAAFGKIDDTTDPGRHATGRDVRQDVHRHHARRRRDPATFALDLHCLDQGDAEIRARIFAEVDQSALFPTSLSPNEEQTVKVV
jgi:hypothetical protein